MSKEIVVAESEGLAAPAGDSTQAVLTVAVEVGRIVTILAETRRERVKGDGKVEEIEAETRRDVEKARNEVKVIVEERLTLQERGKLALEGLREVTRQLALANTDETSRRYAMEVARDLYLKVLDQK